MWLCVCVYLCVALHYRATSWNALTFYCSPDKSRYFSILICQRRDGEEDLPLHGKSRRERQTDREKMRERKSRLHRDASWPFSRPSQMSLNRRSWRSVLEMGLEASYIFLKRTETSLSHGSECVENRRKYSTVK